MKPIKTLKVSISGIRGVVGDSLKPRLVCRFTQAFGTYLGRSSIVVGRDTRTSGEMVQHAAVSGLLSTGARVLDLGITPVPTIQLAVRNLTCRGGIAVTASHNPAEWNALKFIKSTGCFLNAYQAEELLSLYHQQDFATARTSELQNLETYPNAVRDHLDLILEKLKPQTTPRLKVVIDCCNGAGSVMTPTLLRELGCEVVELNCIPDGKFPRKPEPVPANLSQLCRAVVETGADVGFAQDADADRLAVVSEKGEAIGEEYTLALCAQSILSQHRNRDVVINLSTSRMVEAIAQSFDCPVHRSRIGEVNVTEAMLQHDAVFGGEGNGGVIYPSINMARDSFVGIAIILDLMRSRKQRISQIVESLPRYRMAKYAYEIHPHRIPTLLTRLVTVYADENPTLLDGVKVDRPEGWFHVRGSNTEPIVRLVIETATEDALQSIHHEMQQHFQEFI